MQLSATPAHLARIRVRCKRHLLCSAIAGDGSHVAASDALAPHLFALSMSAGKRIRVTKRQLGAEMPAAQHMARSHGYALHTQPAPRLIPPRSSAQVFTSDGGHLALAALAGPVHLVAVDTGAATHVFRSHLTSSLLSAPAAARGILLPPVTHMCVSPDR